MHVVAYRDCSKRGKTLCLLFQIQDLFLFSLYLVLANTVSWPITKLGLRAWPMILQLSGTAFASESECLPDDRLRFSLSLAAWLTCYDGFISFDITKTNFMEVCWICQNSVKSWDVLMFRAPGCDPVVLLTWQRKWGQAGKGQTL